MSNLSSSQDYVDALNTLVRRYMRNDIVFPLMLSNPKRTRLNLDKAGSLYQCAMTSLNYLQYQRAAWYILALEKYFSKHFNETVVERALNHINQEFTV